MSTSEGSQKSHHKWTGLTSLRRGSALSPDQSSKRIKVARFSVSCLALFAIKHDKVVFRRISRECSIKINLELGILDIVIDGGDYESGVDVEKGRFSGFNLKSETLPFYIIEFHTVASKMVVKLAKNNDSRQFIEHIIHHDSPAMDFSTFCKYSNMFKDYEEWKFGSKDSPLSKAQRKQKDDGGKDATNSGKINTLTKQTVMKGKNLVSHSTLQCTAVLYSAEGRTEYVQSMNHGPIAIRLTDLERSGKAVEVVLPDGSQRKLAIRSDKDKSKMKVMNGSTRSEGMIQLEINQSLYIFMFHNSKESKQFLVELGVEQSLEANDVIQYRAIFKAGRESSSLYVETAKPQSRDTVSSRTRNGTTETLTPILQKSGSNSSHPQQKPLEPSLKPFETVPSPPPPPSSPPKSVALIYPAKGMNLVTLHAEDIDRLKEGEFLNDSLIEFYIRWTTNTYATKTNDTFHIFNTFFYQSLSTREDGTIGRVSIPETFTKVKRWTKTINIFSKRFLVVPINERVHWYLAVIWNPGALLRKYHSQFVEVGGSNVPSDATEEVPASNVDDECRVFIFDSLRGSHPNVGKYLMLYLLEEAKDKLQIDLSKVIPDISSQRSFVKYAKVQDQLNYCDCGLFLLHYITTMIRSPDLVKTAIVNGDRLDTPQFGSLLEIRAMRVFMKEVIDDLQEKAEKHKLERRNLRK